MIFNQNYNNVNIRYFDNLIKIDIANIKNNIEKVKIYMYLLNIFKINKCNMIIRYCDIEYIISSDKELKLIFKNL